MDLLQYGGAEGPPFHQVGLFSSKQQATFSQQEEDFGDVIEGNAGLVQDFVRLKEIDAQADRGGLRQWNLCRAASSRMCFPSRLQQQECDDPCTSVTKCDSYALVY